MSKKQVEVHLPQKRKAKERIEKDQSEKTEKESPKKERKKRRFISKVWKYFEKIDGKEEAKCKTCDSIIQCKGGSTSGFHSHLKTHSIESEDETKPSQSKIFLSLSKESSKQKLVEWVVANQNPFTVSEDPFFQAFVKELNPVIILPSADTVKESIMAMYQKMSSEIKDELRNVPGRISFSLDVWTSLNFHSFLGVTAHWITGDWTLRNKLIDMVPLKKDHTGANMCASFMETLRKFDIKDKFFALTTDGASNNDTLFKELLKHFEGEQREMIEKNHIKCFSHIMNLSVHSIIGALDKHSQVLDRDHYYEDNEAAEGDCEDLDESFEDEEIRKVNNNSRKVEKKKERKKERKKESRKQEENKIKIM